MASKRQTKASGSAKRLNDLRARIGKAKTEEDVKSAWARALGLDYDTSEDIDLYTPQVLFEFKLSAQLSQAVRRAQALAQAMYYLRRMRFGQDRRAVPPFLALIDRDTAVLGSVADWHDVFGEREGRFDWDLAPSKADPRLAASLLGHPALRRLDVYSLASDVEADSALRELDHHFAPQASLDFGAKKLITEDNFEDVFAYWHEVFGNALPSCPDPMPAPADIASRPPTSNGRWWFMPFDVCRRRNGTTIAIRSCSPTSLCLRSS